jgi:hypothetical protein
MLLLEKHKEAIKLKDCVLIGYVSPHRYRGAGKDKRTEC